MYVDPATLQTFTACRLMALDKCPGIRPIGISEVVRRIIGKAIISITKDDIRTLAGSVQLVGEEAGCEVAVHSMKQVLESEETHGIAIVLVDASNAFNTLNREVALRNLLRLYPSITRVLINACRGDGNLYIDCETFSSQEGTTQGKLNTQTIFTSVFLFLHFFGFCSLLFRGINF